MSYIDTTVYDMKDPCAYPKTTADDLTAAAVNTYNTTAVNVVADATLPRYTGITITDDGGTPVIKGTQSSQVGTTKKPSYSTWDGKTISCSALSDSYTINAQSPTKYPDVVSVYIYGGPWLVPDRLTAISQADFDENSKLTLTVEYEGKTYFDFSISEVIIHPTESIASHSYTAGTDYNVEYSLTTSDGKDTVTIVITVIPDSTLATDLANRGYMEIECKLQQHDILLTPGVDYTVTYAPRGGDGALTNAPDAVITPIIPAGYAGISAAIRINSKQTVFSGPCDGITMYDTPATGPRKATVWTSGTFKSSDISNYLPVFTMNKDMKFI